MDDDWLKELKVGDEVAWRYSRHFDWSIIPVARITDTQIIIAPQLGYEHRFRRSDGRALKGLGSASHEIRRLDANLRAEIEHIGLYNQAAKKCECLVNMSRYQTGLWKCTDDELRQIAAILDAAAARTEGQQ